MHTAYSCSLLVVCILFLSLACSNEVVQDDFVARVGDRYLTAEELGDALRNTIVPADSADNRRQIIERWIDNELLYQEALRRNLDTDEEVLRLLEENKRSILTSAVIEALYEELITNPSYDEIRTYYDQNREQLVVREPFIQVRYIESTTEQNARSAMMTLRTLNRVANPDSVWAQTVQQFSKSPTEDLQLALTYVPERQLFLTEPTQRALLRTLGPGQTSSIQTIDNGFFVLQVVDRVPTGATPELEWIEDELRQRLIIQSRKLMYARQVQRLRTESLAREQLEIR